MKKLWRAPLFYSLSLFIFSTAALPLAAQAQVTPAPAGHYDELFDEDGKLRSQYRNLEEQFRNYNSAEEATFLYLTKMVFQGDNSLSPIPRILTARESAHLREGVDQRARALVAFLKDHYSGEREYARQGIIPENTIKAIIARAGESGYDGQIDVKNIAFMYGPDIIRDRKGTWRVIEDNPGFIGGIGDMKLANELTLTSSPELQQMPLAKPDHFYQRLALALKEQALARGGKAIIFAVPPYADKEDSRIRKIFAELGIETVTPNTKKRLEIGSKAVFTVHKEGNKVIREKVGFIFMNTEHAHADHSSPAVRERFFVEAAYGYLKQPRTRKPIREEILEIFAERDRTGTLDLQRLENAIRKVAYVYRNAAPGLVEAILQGKVGSNYSAGVDFIGDKELYVHVEKMIEFYLKEKPILRNIETESLADNSGKLKTELAKQITQSPQDYVIKKVDGRGGDAVWVGAKLSKNDMKTALQNAKTTPELYIVQKYTPLSVMHNQIVDLRSITAILPNQIIVTETPWGRGLPIDGNGKVNLSDQGREVTILSIRSDPLVAPISCRKAHAL